jgi:hypothetical protein
LQKKAPNALKSLDAELKSAPVFRLPNVPSVTKPTSKPTRLSTPVPWITGSSDRRSPVDGEEHHGGFVECADRPERRSCR